MPFARQARLIAAIVVFRIVCLVQDAAAADCAWPVKVNRETLNVAFPDTASTYWSYRYRFTPGTEIKISGEAAHARYFSLNTYNYGGVNIDGISDLELDFSGASATAHTDHWSVILRSGVKPGATPGVLAATADASEWGMGVLIYRVYVPQDPNHPAGGVPLPVVTIRNAGGETVLAACEHPGGSLLVEAFLRIFAPQPIEQPRSKPVFLRPASAEGFFPNRDNKYLAALTTWVPGRVAVVRGRAPMVPGDMRYWSFCSNEYRMPYPVVACMYDGQVTTGVDGTYTFVISTPDDRPLNAQIKAGMNWLPWGSTRVTNILLLRNMLPQAKFAHAIQRVLPGNTGKMTMVTYYPEIYYCTRNRFESLGHTNCRSIE